MRIVGFTFCLFFLGCTPKKAKQQNDTTTSPASLQKTMNYDSCKKQVALIQQKNAAKWKQLSIQQKQRIFTQTITATIIPSWIGTAWSFSGTSQTPQQGSIACGYFVTTVLQDGGVRLARVKLAQCASEQMITTKPSKAF
jgi:hypothetical protein